MSRTHETEIVIHAPVAAVWAQLIDFAEHAQWSDSFVLHGVPSPGARGRVGFRIFGLQMSHPIRLETVEPLRRLAWRGGPRGLISGRHYFELRSHGSDGAQTRLVHGEAFEGFAVPVLWPLLMKALGPSYDRFNQQLRDRVESACS